MEFVQDAHTKEYMTQTHKHAYVVMDLNLFTDHVSLAAIKMKLEYKEFVLVLQDSIWLMENVINAHLIVFILIIFSDVSAMKDILHLVLHAERTAQINKN